MDKQAKKGFFPELLYLVRTHVRDYAMFIALAVIFIIFGIFTGGNFLSPRNLTNLINQTGYIAVMACAMTLILIIRQIDLSVGYAAGFTGAIAAILMVKAGVPWYLTIPIILLLGIAIGLVEGSIISFIGVPAFVTTLAFEFIFRGLLSLVTSESGTIPIADEAFNAISNGFVPNIGFIDAKTVPLIVGALAVVLLVISQIRNRQNLQKYNFEVASLPVFIMKLVLMSALIGAVAVILANYRGLSWTIVVVAFVTFIYNFMLNRTKLGRHIYGVGGNPEAAALAGINVKKIMLFCFASMGMMSALGGILFASRLQSASTTGGAGFELDAIASCYIGGVSTSGGVGKVTNTIIGALVIMSLTNGLNLMGVGIAYQYVIKGLIFIVAVAFDVLSRRK